MMNPADNAGQLAAEADVIALLQDDRVKAAREHVGRLWRNAWADAIPDEVVPGIESMLDEYLANWLFKAAASDSQHPRFVRNFMPPHSWHGHDVPGTRTGGDNPDNIYRLAGVAHGTRYRVTGRPVGREPANVSFTLVGDYGTSVTIATIESHMLERRPDGSFVLTIDDEPAGARRNHMTTAPHVKFLYVRDSMEDWEHETPFALEIERLGEPSTAPLSREEMAQAAVFRAREDVPLYFWFQSTFINMRLNSWKFLPANRGTGGLVTQALGRGYFDLGPDNAVIIDCEPAGAAYCAIELSNWLFQSLDADRITSSLNRGQCTPCADGRLRAVISRRDPGVANWLDCGGFSRVMMMLRWQGLPPEPPRGGPGFTARLVPLADLRGALPGDMRWLTARERDEQRAARKAAFARRYALNAQTNMETGGSQPR
ncbi:hypothetical protein SAMN05518801_104194 [Novosphingobium sp. CF614]|uniref:hypothetical protein n=1 Tax=Novosphingobium sp. CF614 TaxID=1884364 RepID=UPI0008E555C9|nr:hypothetical protein [Novosphingobium sp. CF614]SFF96304.1 hypothetical protein SAMN05518801_104194 [Novosphingobium sp. CF614]